MTEAIDEVHAAAERLMEAFRVRSSTSLDGDSGER